MYSNLHSASYDRTIAHASADRVVTSQRKVWWLVILVGGVLAVLLPVVFLAGVVGYYQYHGMIVPGVNAGGVAVGNLDRSQGAEAVNRTWNVDRKIQVTDGSQTWEVPASFFGLWVDPNASVDLAYRVGRGEDGVSQVIAAVEGETVSFPPVVTFNPGVAREALTRWAATIDRPAVDASIRLEAGQPVVTPAQPGIALDVERTLAGIAADPGAALISGKAWVFFTPVTPQLVDVSAVEAEARTLLSTELGGAIYDAITNEHIPWKVPPDTVAGWVRIDATADGYHAVLDEASLADYLAHLSDHLDLGPGRTVRPLDDPAATAREILQGKPAFSLVAHLPGTYTVQGGETLLTVAWKLGVPLWRMQKANPDVNPNALSAGQTLVVPSYDDLLPLPVVANKRIVISITSQRMWVYEDGQHIREFVISTGIASSPTQPGVFQVQTHELNAYAEKWDLYMPHWMGIYEAWPGFMNGIHGLPMLSSGVRLWKNVLGSPASYGCIILDLPQAEWLYNWAENGVVVEIQR